VQDDKFTLYEEKVKLTIVARAKLPEPAFDSAGVRQAQVGAEFFQQAKNVVDLGPVFGGEVIDKIQHGAFSAAIFVEVDLPHEPESLL
jgi:hypothetical protein